jgi:hypothetical protein
LTRNYPLRQGACITMAGPKNEAVQFARGIILDSAYKANLKKRANDGSLPPAVETLLFHYAFGKPVENVSVISEDSLDIGGASVDQLVERSRQLYATLERLQQEDRLRAEEATRKAEEDRLAREASARAIEEAAARERELQEKSVFHRVESVH